MGLRINTNLSAITALRTLHINERNQTKSLERLSTGLRINRGSDDPSGLVISEQVRAQLRALDQAVSNSQNAANLLNIADAALQETSNLLVQIQDSIVFAQNTGGASPDQITAEQDAVDQAIAAVDRISATTRFADRPLLNGNAEFQVAASLPDFFDDLNVKSATFPAGAFTRSLVVSPSVNPQRATIQITGAGTGAAGATVRITGPRGTEDVVIIGAATAAVISSAINGVSGFTGVYASGTGLGDVVLRSEAFGTSQFIKIEGVAGGLTGTAFNFLDDSGTTGAYAPFAPAIVSPLDPGEVVSDRGRNGTVTFEGQAFTGIGNQFNILARSAQFAFKVDPELITTEDGTVPLLPAGPFTITVANTGLNFQLNELPLPTDQLAVSIAPTGSAKLGLTINRDRIAEAGIAFASTVDQGGFLNTIRTGAGNDLFQNPGNASKIVRAAVIDVASLRGFLGAVQADAIEPNIDSLGVAIESLSNSLSDLRDLDFAEETTNFTKQQILFQSGIAVLGNANSIPQAVLRLLTG